MVLILSLSKLLGKKILGKVPVILMVCVAGSTITAYMRGLTKGSEATLVILEEQKLIRVDKNGEITPYK